MFNVQKHQTASACARRPQKASATSAPEQTPARVLSVEAMAALYEGLAAFDAAFMSPVTFYEEPSAEMLMMLDFRGWGDGGGSSGTCKPKFHLPCMHV